MQQNRTKNTLINTSFSILSRIVTMVLGFVQKTIFIRTLGMSYTGVAGLFTDVLTVLSLAELGIASAIAYSLYKPLAENDFKRIAQLMNFFKKAYTWIAIIVFAMGLGLVPFIGYIVKDVPDIKENIQLIFMLYIVNSSVTYLLVYKTTLLVAAQKQYIVSNIQMIFSAITITVQCVTLLIFKEFLLYLVLQICFSLLQNLTINIVATKKYPELKKYAEEKIEDNDKKRLFKDVKALMLYKVSNVVTTGTDSTIISTSLGTGQVGVLGNYSTIRGYISSIIAQFFNAINPSLGNLAATEKKEYQYAVFNKLNFGTFWVTCVCSTCFFCLFNPFIKIWMGSDEWLLSTWVVAVYVLEYFMATMIGPVGAFRTANGLFVQTKYLALIRAIVNLVISIALVKPMGIIGVLLGTLLSAVFTQMWFEPLVLYREVFKRSVFEYYIKLLLYLLINIICCLLVNGMMLALPVMGAWGELITCGGLCIVVSNAVIWIVFHKKQEYKECIGLVAKIIKKLLRR